MIKLAHIFITIFFLCDATPVSAEYRVYQYFVKAQNDLPYDAQSYMTLSTFDPVSFVAYHGGRESIKVDLLNTWMCKGNTAGQDLCPSPYESAPPTVVGSAP